MTKETTIIKKSNKAELAKEVVKRLDECRQLATKNILEVGACLKLMYNHKLFKYIDCETWVDFLGTIGIPYSSAMDAMALYRLYVEGCCCPMGQLANIGHRKLQVLLPYLKKHTDRTETLLDHASYWSVSDTINEVRILEGKSPMEPTSKSSNQLEVPECKNYREYVKNSPCVVCGKSPVNAAHWPVTKGAGGKFTIPLCREHHSNQEDLVLVDWFSFHKRQIGEYLFNLSKRVNESKRVL